MQVFALDDLVILMPLSGDDHTVANEAGADEVTVTIQTNNQILIHPLNTFLRARNIYMIDNSFRITFRDNEWAVFGATEVGVNLSAWQRDFVVQSVRFGNTLTDMARTRLIPVGGDVWCYAEATPEVTSTVHSALLSLLFHTGLSF